MSQGEAKLRRRIYDTALSAGEINALALGSVNVTIDITVFEAVQRRDRGVIERRKQLRFALEPREALAVFGKLFGQHFDGHFTIELRVSSAINLAIPPAPMASTISYSPSLVPGESAMPRKSVAGSPCEQQAVRMKAPCFKER